MDCEKPSTLFFSTKHKVFRVTANTLSCDGTLPVFPQINPSEVTNPIFKQLLKAGSSFHVGDIANGNVLFTKMGWVAKPFGNLVVSPSLRKKFCRFRVVNGQVYLAYRNTFFGIPFTQVTPVYVIDKCRAI